MRFTAIVGALCLATTSAYAGGIYVPGSGGPQAMARAGAFVAKADDPSALFHNPAGFAKGTGTVIMIAANLLSYDLTFARSGNYETPTVDSGGQPQPYPVVKDQSKPAIGIGGFQAIPLIAVTTDFGLDLPGWRFGFGIFAPNGFPERRIDADYDFEDPTRNAPPARYDTVEQDVSAAFPSIGASYSFKGPIEVDVGVRLSWGFAGLNARTYVWAFRNYEEDVGVDGAVDVDASDNFVPSAGIGALVRATPDLEFGLAYNSPSKINATGETTAALGSGADELDIGVELVPTQDERRLICGDAPSGTIAGLNTCVDLTLPQTASVGARYIFRDNRGAEVGDVELDFKWENWSAASDISVRIDATTDPVGLVLEESIVRHGFEDTFSVRLGGAYSFSVGAGKLILRGGAAYDTAAAPNRWQRADLDGAEKMTLTAGIAYQMSSFRVGLAGGRVVQPDRTVPMCEPSTADPEPACTFGGDVPSPSQPLRDPALQFASPFNSGRFSSGYTMLSLGVTTWF